MNKNAAAILNMLKSKDAIDVFGFRIRKRYHSASGRIFSAVVAASEARCQLRCPALPYLALRHLA